MRVLQTLRRDWVLRAVVALAFLVRALLPTGYMFEASASGGLSVVLCSGEGAVHFTVDPATGKLTAKKAQGKADRHDPPCTYSGLAKLAPPEQSLLFEAKLEVDQPIVAAPAVYPGRGLVAPPPPATGPPSSQA